MKEEPVCTKIYKVSREVMGIDDGGDEADYVKC
jgi:hypothetical protein